MSVKNNLFKYFNNEELECIEKEKDLYKKTFMIVDKLFLDKTDKAGRPYIGHLKRVSEKLDGKEKIAGLLHDTLEDTDVTYNDLKEIGIPTDILDIVEIVTFDKIEKNLSRGERINIYHKKIDKLIESGNISAIRLKLVDMTDNYNENRLKLLSKEKRQWFKDKYEPCLLKLKRELKLSTN